MRPGARHLTHPKEKGDHEDDVPQRGERPDKTRAFAHRGVKAQRGIKPHKGLAAFAFGEKDQHDEQGQHAAQIPPCEPIARQPPDGAVIAQFRQHGIGEDRGEFGPDDANAKGDQRPHQKASIGQQDPKPERAQNVKGRKHHDTRHAPPGVVGERAKDRCTERNHHPRHRLAQRPQALRARIGNPFGQALRHEAFGRDGGEIGAEHKGQAQREIGLARPVKGPPAPDAAAQGGGGQGGGIGCGDAHDPHHPRWRTDLSMGLLVGVPCRPASVAMGASRRRQPRTSPNRARAAKAAPDPARGPHPPPGSTGPFG